VGVFNVVPGPGFLNAGAALATAYGLNAPVFCLTGQIPSHQIGREIGILHEIPDQLGMMQRLTKWAARANSPAEIPMLITEAFRQMQSGRPRPVGLEIPMDVLAQTAVTAATPPPLPLYQPPLNHEQIEAAANLLAQAKQPLIFTGSGAQNVSAAVTALAERLQAPVVAYRTGQGVMDGRSHLSLHMPAAHALWQTADVVLAVGTNLREPLRWGVDKDLTIIRIDVDPTAHGRIRQPDLAITARAEEALPLLVEKVKDQGGERPSRRDELLALKADWAARTAYLEPQNSYLCVIREALGEDGILLDELTQVGFAARITYPVYKPRTFISTGYQGTLGYGFPTALGVKVARPDTPVIAIAGDGGFMFAVQELATAVQHQIALVTLIFNNSQYGNVQQMQKHNYGGRVIATDLRNPDFVKMAESYGAQAFRAQSPHELRQAIRQGLALADVPTIIEIPIGDVPSTDRFRGLPRIR
jgi:acetolactate synthase-1/2/3 large subunit